MNKKIEELDKIMKSRERDFVTNTIALRKSNDLNVGGSAGRIVAAFVGQLPTHILRYHVSEVAI